MTFEVLEEIRLFVGSTGRAAKQSALNCRLNGYKELALRHDNESAMADKIMRALANEHGDGYAQNKSDY